MNKEDIEKIIEMTINKSDKKYISLKKDFDELLSDYIELSRIEEQLQNNWNELKKWLESKGTSTKDENDALCYFYTYNKMQELEGNNECI